MSRTAVLSLAVLAGCFRGGAEPQTAPAAATPARNVANPSQSRVVATLRLEGSDTGERMFLLDDSTIAVATSDNGYLTVKLGTVADIVREFDNPPVQAGRNYVKGQFRVTEEGTLFITLAGQPERQMLVIGPNGEVTGPGVRANTTLQFDGPPEARRPIMLALMKQRPFVMGLDQPATHPELPACAAYRMTARKALACEQTQTLYSNRSLGLERGLSLAATYVTSLPEAERRAASASCKRAIELLREHYADCL